MRRQFISNVIKLAALLTAAWIPTQTPKQPDPPVQPIPYSHKKHVAIGLNCQGCHPNPDPGERMTLPATAMCMACHETVATDKSAIQKLAGFARSKEPIPWARIYLNPDWVWFSHRAHLAAGAKCDTCHGPVSERDVLWKEGDISMNGCMNCHRQYNASNDCNYCHESR